MELLFRLRLEELTFDTSITRFTKGPFQRMIVLRAVRVIFDNVEVGRCECFGASPANEAFFVISASQTAVC
jgi:hypothetical protein